MRLLVTLMIEELAEAMEVLKAVFSKTPQKLQLYIWKLFYWSLLKVTYNNTINVSKYLPSHFTYSSLSNIILILYQ